MLQIEYNGKFLRTGSNTAVEFDKNSPLFQLDTLLAEYTMPITIVYCDENVQILGDTFFEYGIKTKKKLEVNLYDNGSFFCSSILVIDNSIIDSRVRNRGSVQGYFLSGVSAFFSVIKDRKLNSLLLGGVRKFNFTSWDANDLSNGYWQHFHNTWDGNSDYVMIPHRNESWIEEEWFDGWVNQLGRGYSGGIPDFPIGQVEQFSWVVLFPKVKYVLECLFTENGWKLDTSGINDDDWEKLLLFSTTPIVTNRGDGIDVYPMPSVSFQLSKMISPEIYMSEFLLAICNRYGWAPLCDGDTKICRLVALKEKTKGVLKDFTEYATGVYSVDFTENLRKFSFKQEAPKNDAKSGTADFTNFNIQQPVASARNLPTPTVNHDNALIFCFLENAYYKVIVNADNEREWVKHFDNIYDEELADATDIIETKCTTLPMELSEYREDASGIKYYGYFPTCSIPRNKEFGIRTLIYHGMVKELKADGTEGTQFYPLASSLAVIPNGTVQTAWSNVYKHDNAPNKYGIIDYWFKEWLRVLKVSNSIQVDLHLPLFELMNLKWDDIINIRNQPYLMKKYIEPRPYKGMIRATLQPLLLNDQDEAIAETPTTYYVKLFFENIETVSSPWWTNYKTCSVIARVYSDPAGTNQVIPATTLTLNIVFRATNLDTSQVTLGGPESHDIGMAENLIWEDAMYEGTTSDPYDFKWDYVILPGTGYIAIP